jgi:ABC-type multidrug transport system ATPase subunit
MEISITHLSKAYGATRALDDLSLEIPGGLFGLLGPNGAGKTTLMRLLATLLSPTGGDAHVGPYDLRKQPEQVRRVLGYLPQEFGFYRNLNAFEMLDYVAIMKNVPRPQRRRAIQTVLEQVGLADRARQRTGTYSGGMRQRLGIAQALLGDPQVMIVDEPTAGLDPEERIRFRNLMVALAEERTILLSTHIVGDIQASCTGVAVLDAGRLLFSGSPDELGGRARGRLWEVTLNLQEWVTVQSGYRVVASQSQDGVLRLRLIGQENPFGRGEPLEPGLEDGYVAVMQAAHTGTRERSHE